ncbi:MAG: C4-type zinc ribbon domain-containing protein [Actinomycetota bacterium]|nr:C4-type zinc ribbon domain-containing protein [Actinomycetota bacterium]
MSESPNQGRLLLELQKSDIEIKRLSKRLEELPERAAILEVRHKNAEIQALRVKAVALIDGLGRQIKAAEDETSQIDEKLRSEQQKLMSGDVTNAKEVNHISREMDALKRRKDKLDVGTIDIMEKAEKASGQMDKIDLALTQLTAREARLTEAYKLAGTEVQNEISHVEKRRVTICSALDPDLLTRYTQVRSAKGVVAVGALEGHTCTACRIELPSERVADLLIGSAVATCPECGRMIVVKPGTADE